MTNTTLDDVLADAAARPGAQPWDFIVPDLLRETGRWSRPVVNELVCRLPEADWPRLVAAEWFEEHAGMAACGACVGHCGHIIVEKGQPQTPANAMSWRDYKFGAGYGYRQTTPTSWRKCPTCHRSGRVPDGNAARGEFIRVQVELARLEPTIRTSHRNVWPEDFCSCRWCELRRRERELWAHLDDWYPVKPAGWANWVWDRGFVSGLECSSIDWLAHADALAWHPGQTVACPEKCNSLEYMALDDGGGGRVCSRCLNSGTVPRPCPPTAQPVREVTLTTSPDWPLWVRVGDRSLVNSINPEMRSFFTDRWPGITFHLPPLGDDI